MRSIFIPFPSICKQLQNWSSVKFIPFFLLIHFLVHPIVAVAKTDSLESADQLIVDEIYTKLKLKIGDTQKQFPKLKIWGIKDRIATFDSTENTIYLDDYAVQKCKSLPNYKAAFAFIIGHELTHFYQEHDWEKSGFVTHFLIKTVDFKKYQQHEKQADVYGAFIAEQAGFRAIEIVNPLLDILYEAYDLPKKETLEYPSLKERKKLARQACQLATNLVNAYETANYAMVLGRFQEAHSLYDYVSQNLKFKEVYFNLGMSYLLAYYYLDDTNTLAYPFEVDPQIPIRRTLADTKLIESAIAAFHKVNREYDTNYFSTTLHLITAYDWLGDKSAALRIIDNLEKIIPKGKKAIFNLVVANFFWRNERKKEAITIYKQLLNNQATPKNIAKIATINLKQIMSNYVFEKQSAFMPDIRTEKGIDGITSLALFPFKNDENVASVNYGVEKELFVYEARNSFLTKLIYQKSKINLQRIFSAKISTNNHIRIGDHVTEINKRYSSKNLGKVSFIGGYYNIIPEKGLIFKCTTDDIIEEWVVFTF